MISDIIFVYIKSKQHLILFNDSSPASHFETQGYWGGLYRASFPIRINWPLLFLTLILPILLFFVLQVSFPAAIRSSFLPNNSSY